MKDKTMRDLFLDELQDLYDAEQQLVKALPKVAEAASEPELRTAIESHLDETRGHVARLDHAFNLLGEEAKGKTCAGIAGIIKEANQLIGDSYQGSIKDAGLIAGAQRAEHYEIGAYGSVIAWAKLIGQDGIANLLHETLEEEKAADAKLTAIAEERVNTQAASMM